MNNRLLIGSNGCVAAIDLMFIRGFLLHEVDSVLFAFFRGQFNCWIWE